MGDTSGGHGPPDNSLQNEDDLPLRDIAQLQKQLQDSQSNNNSVIDFGNKYRPTDKAPYIVFVEHQEKNLGRLFPVRVGHYLLECDKRISESVVDIKVVGINRVKVILKTYNAANSLVNNEVLRKQKLLAYIPKFYTQKKGVIKMVDTFFSEEYLLKSIESKYRIMEVKRLRRKIKDTNTGEEKLIDRQMILVSFLGNELPQEIRINRVNFSVEPYVHPVIQCRTCLRFGHTERLCRGKPRCKTCGKTHETEDVCEEVLMCTHCGSTEHGSLSRKCPAFLKQKSIKEIMAYRNVSFKEAEQLFKNPSYSKVVNNNRFAILSNEENFPELPPSSVSKNLPKPRTNIAHNKPSNSNHSSPSASNKRRKTSVSPERSPKRDHESTDIEKHPVIPNPYRREFLEYRDSLINQVSNFLVEVLAKSVRDSKAIQIIKDINIKDSLSSFLNNQDDYMDCDAISVHSSY